MPSVTTKGTKELKTFGQLADRVKNRILEKIKHITPLRRRDIMSKALMFCKANPDILIIIADPKRDDIIASYNNHYSATTIRGENFPFIKKHNHIIRTLINRDLDELGNERAVNNFLQFIDGYLYNLSNKINNKVADSQPEAGKPKEDQNNATNT